jgi:hypothetical protein|tara:strand:- start:22 stop:198 length:177 start_codon:yes stop_codon:yes gene_type:complete
MMMDVSVYIYDGWMETINLAESLGWDSTEAWEEDRDPDTAEDAAMTHIKDAGMQIVFP